MNNRTSYTNNIKPFINDINTKPLILKRTQFTNVNYQFIEQIENFYWEGNQKFVWLKQWRHNIFIYGDPFTSYNFG
jgi:hypothetical protein